MLWIVSEWPPFRRLRSTLFWAARPRLLWLRIADAAALARMLPETPTEEQRTEVAFQAWTDAAIRSPIIHANQLMQQLDEDSQKDLPEAQDAPTK